MLGQMAGASPGYSQGLQGQANLAPTKAETSAQIHANRLHSFAEELAVCNCRLESFVERMIGASPVNPSKETPAATPQTGVLVVAQFGAQRIGYGLDQLRNLLTKLEEIA